MRGDTGCCLPPRQPERIVAAKVSMTVQAAERRAGNTSVRLKVWCVM